MVLSVLFFPNDKINNNLIIYKDIIGDPFTDHIFLSTKIFGDSPLIAQTLNKNIIIT